jgi:hypothetical protein
MSPTLKSPGLREKKSLDSKAFKILESPNAHQRSSGINYFLNAMKFKAEPP